MRWFQIACGLLSVIWPLWLNHLLHHHHQHRQPVCSSPLSPSLSSCTVLSDSLLFAVTDESLETTANTLNPWKSSSFSWPIWGILFPSHGNVYPIKPPLHAAGSDSCWIIKKTCILSCHRQPTTYTHAIINRGLVFENKGEVGWTNCPSGQRLLSLPNRWSSLKKKRTTPEIHSKKKEFQQ